MHLIRRYRHATEKGSTTGALVRLVAEALKHAQYGEVFFHAYFADSDHQKVSALSRLLDRYPSLLLHDDSAGNLDLGQPAPVMSLTSMPPPSPIEPADPTAKLTRSIRTLDLSTAIDIADGIPQRYPFRISNFLVSPVPLFATIPAAPRRSLTAYGIVEYPEILISSSSGSPRRRIELHSGVACNAPTAGQKRLAPLPSAVKSLLTALGKAGREEQHLVLDEDERATHRDRASALSPEIERLDAALEASWSTAPFPYPLQDDHRHEERDMDLRAELAAAFRPLGFSQIAGGFRRRTTSGYEISLHYDRKPLANTTAATLTVSGQAWSHSATMWPHAMSKTLRIRSPQTARLYAANLVAAVNHATALWAEPLAALHKKSDE